jgi:lipopolysaccharide biosynthesis glycosyltransferase
MCVDENYLLPSLVTLTSIADATPPRDRRCVAVRFLTTDLTASQVETTAAFTRRLGFNSFDIAWQKPSAHHRIINGNYISTTTYLRFGFTPAFVRHPYLVYVNADVLVLGDLAAPLNQIHDGQVGLVRDIMNHTVGRGVALPGAAARWPHLRGRPYFNAGMLWTTASVVPHLRRHIDRIMRVDAAHIFFNDQDALNLWALRNDTAVQPLNPAYNTFELGRFYEAGDWVHRVVSRMGPQPSSPAVLHFVGPTKPWHASCPATGGTRIYRQYLHEAAKHVQRLGDLTLDIRQRRRSPEHRASPRHADRAAGPEHSRYDRLVHRTRR